MTLIKLSCLALGLLLTIGYTESVSVLPRGLMRKAKCIIPNGSEHISRAVLFQQCISNNYAQGNETQCYPELGCFPMDSPWTSLLRPFPAPMHPAEINVMLYCYTRDSPQRYNITLWPEIDLNGCPFSEDKRTVFIAHGFASNGNSSWLSDLKDTYLQVENVTVILVDWGMGAELLNYLQVASNTRVVGAELARFIKYLNSTYNMQPSKVHLIGHSLGAHVCAYAAKAVPGIQRLTGLDPAQPGFERLNKTVRFDKGDAHFVEVVHTNAAPFLPTLGFGMILPSGHVDFYMNGGLSQPGCRIPDFTEISNIKDLAKFPVEVINMWVSCSHGRAYEYYTQVLQSNCTIWGRMASLTRHILNAGTHGFIEPLFSKLEKCDPTACIPLGLDTPDFEARGTFAATTHKSFPFCESDAEVNRRILAEVKGMMADAVDKVTGVVSKTVERGTNLASGVVGRFENIGGLVKNTVKKDD